MHCKFPLLLILVSIILFSCWKYRGSAPNDDGGYSPPAPRAKVWGYKPVYGVETTAKAISFTSSPRPVVSGGNIYAYQNYIFQVETGYGIHVIDNSISSDAHRIGFINVNGCAQISIRGDKLYTNSYDDLVVIDFPDLNHIRESGRAKGVFTEYRYYSPIAQPPGPGYYECPDYGNFVVGWKMDSVAQLCYKTN